MHPNDPNNTENNHQLTQAMVPSKAPMNAAAEIEQQRAIAETQAAMIIAKKFPRDVDLAIKNITAACKRPGLAEQAVYEYARGGTGITGPSIRLAEAIAQAWGNMQFGIRELSQQNGESTVEAFAWDIETNTRQVKVFQVAHKRYTRNGSYALKDPRDIYEIVANNGARRLRACILGTIPGDVVETALKQCDETVLASVDISKEGIDKLLAAFERFKVNQAMIVKRIQRNMDAITARNVVSLRRIYNALADGMGKTEDYFDDSLASAASVAPKTAKEAATKPVKPQPASNNEEIPAIVRQKPQKPQPEENAGKAGDQGEEPEDPMQNESPNLEFGD